MTLEIITLEMEIWNLSIRFKFYHNKFVKIVLTYNKYIIFPQFIYNSLMFVIN